MRVKSSVALLPFILFTGGCAVGYNSTLFMTKSNIGIDVDTKPPTAEISIARREVVIAPSFEGGQTPPVLGSFRVASKGWFNRPTDILSSFLFGVESIFAGGDAAVVLSQGAGRNSKICLSKEPNPKENQLSPDVSMPGKGEVEPLLFTTDMTLGLKAAWSGVEGPIPEALRLGFSRKEFAWAPVLEADTNGCTTPDTDKNGTYAVKMPSFLAVLDIDAEKKDGIKMLQYFATGKAATGLAENGAIRDAIMKRIDPAFELVTYDSKDPTVACIEAWIKEDRSNRSKEVQQWWDGKQLKGFAVLKDRGVRSIRTSGAPSSRRRTLTATTQRKEIMMPEGTELEGISEAEVGEKVQQLVETGAKKIECIKQNGKWTIRAS